MSYSTGEIAALCGVTVRTVQYYDGEGLLKPEGFSEGGRRVYGDDSLKVLQLICIYKKLGLSIAEIKEILSDEQTSGKILSSVLDRRERQLDDEIKERLSCKQSVALIKQYLAEGKAMTPNIFSDIRIIMKANKKLKTLYACMCVFGGLSTAAWVTGAVLWALKGLWLPFAVALPCAVVVLSALTVIYYRSTQYICPNCGKTFRQKFGKWFFSAHTPRTRKLVCPHCGEKDFCTEIGRD